MFSCFSSDFWCVPTTPAAGTAGGAAGWVSWQRWALLAPPGWPTPAQIKAGENVELAGWRWRCGGWFSKLAFSKITEAGSLPGNRLRGAAAEQRAVHPASLASLCRWRGFRLSILCGWRGHRRWVGVAGAGWAVGTRRTRVCGERRVNTVTSHYVPACCRTGAGSGCLHPPCLQPEPGWLRPRAGAWPNPERLRRPRSAEQPRLIKKLLRNL